MEEKLVMIPVKKILPNPDQPRTEFDQVELEDLAHSITMHGLIHAIVVEGPYDNGTYVLVDGERRWRAHKLAGLEKIKAHVRCPKDGKDQERFLQAVIANMQRSDLNPIEEAHIFKRLSLGGMTHNAIGRLVGRSNAHISYRLKLLEFEEGIQHLFAENKLPNDPGSVYALARIPREYQLSLCTKFAAKGTSIGGIKSRVTRFMNHLGSAHETSLTNRGRAPAIVMSEIGKEAKIFKVLQDKHVDLPELKIMRQAAAETCKNCELAEVASTSTCSTCPAVELMQWVAKLAEKEG